MPRMKLPIAPDTELGNELLAKWPKRLPLNPLERILTALGIVILVFTTLFVLMRYGSMPDEIPTHYGTGGEVDALGSKTEIWILLVVDIVCVGMVLFVNRFPRAINIPLALMKRPAEEIIHATRLMMCWVGDLCAVMFAYLIRQTVLGSAAINEVFVFFLVALMLVAMIPYYIYLMRP